MIGARFRVDRVSVDGNSTVLRPLPNGDEGLFRDEPSGSVQLGRVSDAGVALLAQGTEVRIYFVAASTGPQVLVPADAAVLTPEAFARTLAFPTADDKARAQEALAAAAQQLPSLPERLAALRREVLLLPGTPEQVQAAIFLLEITWMAVLRAQGMISIEDPPPAPPASSAAPAAT